MENSAKRRTFSKDSKMCYLFVVSDLTLPFSEGRNVYGEEYDFIGKGVSGVQQKDSGLTEDQPFRTGFRE